MAERIWINGKFSVFHTDDMGSIPIIRTSLLGEIGKHDRLKICSLWVIGSSPIVSTKKIEKKWPIN
jgi:hypothetical protein